MHLTQQTDPPWLPAVELRSDGSVVFSPLGVEQLLDADHLYELEVWIDDVDDPGRDDLKTVDLSLFRLRRIQGEASVEEFSDDFTGT
jgi:hypothetical protein